MRVAQRFQTLLSRIEPLQTEVDAAYTHADSVKARLAKSFALKKFVVIGSHARGTAIRAYSDVDFFAVISRADVRWGDGYVRSCTILDRVREDLGDRFWRTGTTRDGQAIMLNFGSGTSAVDVVPAFFWEMGTKWPIYQMPDGAGEWMTTNPELHGSYLRRADVQSGGKLRRTVQLLKFWRECRHPRIPLSSIHLELVLASERVCTGVQTYAQCLASAWQVLADRGCRSLRDPLQIAGLIPAAKTPAQEEQVLRSVLYARDRALGALNAEGNGDYQEALRQWDLIYNGNFPQR
jgi:predicted nucleotidyltransferase